jgi:hypothetical protein
MTAACRFLTLSAPFLLLAARAQADHGGPLASAPMSPLVTALLAGGFAFVAVLLLALIWHLMTRSRGDRE